jgi:hypothetical protein
MFIKNDWTCKECKFCFNDISTKTCITCGRKRNKNKTFSKDFLSRFRNLGVNSECYNQNNHHLCKICKAEITPDTQKKCANCYDDFNRKLEKKRSKNFTSHFKSTLIDKNYDKACDKTEKRWKQIIDECRRTGQKFIDYSFFPNDTTIYGNDAFNPSSLNRMYRGKVYWARPDQIKSHYYEPWSVMSNPNFNDTKQVSFFFTLLFDLIIFASTPSLKSRCRGYRFGR